MQHSFIHSEPNLHTACLLPSLWSTGSQCVRCQCIVCLCVWSMIVLVHWETLLNERVPQMRSEVLLCVHGHSYTPIPVPASVWVLEFAPTNRPLNLKHIQHMQTYKQPEPPRVSPLTSYLLPLSVCLATTLIGQPSNPHQFLGSQSDSPEPMRCRRGRWTWESPNQIPRSDQSRSLFCCMSVFLRLMTLAYLAFHLSPALPEWVVNGYN